MRGLAREQGVDVTPDFKEAVRWYRLAADQDYAPAQARLGYAYEYGNGVDLDYARAMQLYRKAAEQGDAAASEYHERAERAYRAFNERFWNPDRECLFDVVDQEGGGNDAKIRPNQIFAISLAHPVLARERWAAVLRVVRERLLTPVGLRSLAPDDPDFKPRYFGDLRTRDAAYHQGTVWGWLVGPYIDAWIKVFPDRLSEARASLDGFVKHLDEACVGSISEVFDAEAPYTARGCIAQAWSVAEVLRAWLELARREQMGSTAALAGASLATPGAAGSPYQRSGNRPE